MTSLWNQLRRLAKRSVPAIQDNDVVTPQRLPRISSTLYGPPPAVAR